MYRGWWARHCVLPVVCDIVVFTTVPIFIFIASVVDI